jgi:hypothetical protein
VSTMENNIPGGVYLCQVNDGISCGACCGLYNVSDPSFDSLSRILEQRTRRYEKTERTYDALEAFADWVTSVENQVRPYPEFHHCPYIGLIGENKNRPGCLLHPLGDGNKGTDFRGLSHWGGFACASYFCPTCHGVPARYKEILKGTAENWYIFGLMATEDQCLSRYFSMVEQLMGRNLDPVRDLSNADFTRCVQDFFQVKVTWPFRESPFNRLGNYFFKDALYPRVAIDYPAFSLSVPDCDPILKSLDTRCTTAEETVKAIETIDRLITKTVEAAGQTV